MPQAPSAPYKKLLEDLRSPVPDRQNYAFQSLLKATDSPVGWAYEVWEDLLRTLVDGDNRQRSIAAQVLSNLAKSDPKERMLKDLAALVKVTKDERFVTARHCLQSLWYGVTTVLLNARRGSEQYQSMNSQIAWAYERFELADVRLFRTADFDCSRSGSL